MKRFQTAYLRILIACFASILACSSYAADTVEVVKASGKVVVRQEGQQEHAVGEKSILPAKNTIVTGPDGRAVVKVGDTGYIVVEKNSTVDIDQQQDHAGFFRQVTGMIYYAMNALRLSQKPVEVRMATATIGIRGTRFLVSDLPERREIGMRKGLINVASTDKEFEIHRKAELDEFEAFKQEGKDAIEKQKKEFEEYKAKTQKEFIEYKREFTLGANRMVSFDGQRVDDKPLSGETRKDMENLEAYGKEWLDAVHD